jgi:hypothetical protein
VLTSNIICIRRQVLAHGLVFASFGCYVAAADNVSQRVLGSYALLALYLSVLHFLKCFRQTSFLIEMLVQILKDMRYFVLILFVVASGVALAIVVLENGQGVVDGTCGPLDSSEAQAYWTFASALFKVPHICSLL